MYPSMPRAWPRKYPATRLIRPPITKAMETEKKSLTVVMKIMATQVKLTAR